MDIKNYISIDSNGNLYINNFWVYINKDDNIDFLKINNLSFDNPKNTQKISNQLFKAKMINEEIDNVLNAGEGNNFIDEDDQNNVAFFINNPETKYVNYYDRIDNDFYDNNINNSYYMIFGEYKLAKNNLNFDNSNYEAYFIDSKLNTPIFYTQIINDNAYYRISVYTNNTIKLNLIGTMIKTFSINIENDTITAEIINTHYVNLD